MVAQNTVRAYTVNQVFRFADGIRLLRKSRRISNVRNRFWDTILYNYHGALDVQFFFIYSDILEKVVTLMNSRDLTEQQQQEETTQSAPVSSW